jgi:F-type H+-transporting ATPase subunit b
MLSSAHNDADDLRTRWQRALQQEQDVFVRELRDRVSLHTYQIARRALADLASVEIEQHVIAQFIERIGAMDEEMRAALARAAHNSHQPVTVVSAFDVPPDLRARIVDGIHQHIHPDTDVHFHVSPEVLCGVELKLGEQKLAWSMAGYLDSLEESLAQAFNAEAIQQPTEAAVVE